MNAITPEMYEAVCQQRDEAQSALRLLNVDIAFYREWLSEQRADQVRYGTAFGHDAVIKAQEEFDKRFPR